MEGFKVGEEVKVAFEGVIQKIELIKVPGKFKDTDTVIYLVKGNGGNLAYLDETKLQKYEEPK